MNEAPVTGYGKDVGTKTTLRITYPEGAIQKPESYEKDSLFVFSAFKPLDFKWLRQMVFKEKLVRILLNTQRIKVNILNIKQRYFVEFLNYTLDNFFFVWVSKM